MSASAFAGGEADKRADEAAFELMTAWRDARLKPSIDDSAPDLAALRRESALAVAESLVADAVRLALAEDGRSLRALQRDTGLDPAFVSRLAKGRNCEIASLAHLALALGKTLHLSFEPLGRDDE